MKYCYTDRIRKEIERHRENEVSYDFEQIFSAVGELAYWYSKYDKAKSPREIAVSAITDALEEMPESKWSVLRQYCPDAETANYDKAIGLFAEDISKLVDDFRNKEEAK